MSLATLCRASSPADVIEAHVRRSLAAILAAKPLALLTVSDREQEPDTHAAARRVSLRAVYLRREALLARQAKVTVRSLAAETRLGPPAVAEAAALAGAGPHSVLIVRRVTEGGPTWGVAGFSEEHQ